MVEQHERGTRYQLRLDMIGIRRGDELQLIDQEDETCIVVDPRSFDARVVHRNIVTSLSAACNEVYGYGANNPAMAWTFNGETLNALREKFEEYHRGY